MNPPASVGTPVIQAAHHKDLKLDRAGYFVIRPQKNGTIIVEHHSYDHRLLRIIKGDSAKDIYLTIIENGWVSELSHAAYLGKELTLAELSIRYNSRYIQDRA